MRAVTTTFLLVLADWTTANTATVDAQRARQKALAACQNLTPPVSNDGTTTTISTFPDSSCWDTLDMTDWMTKWNASTTVCAATQSVPTPCQCQADEPWATCFMRLTYQGNRTASYDCTDLTKPENCTEPVPTSVAPGPAEIFYGAYSIWSLFSYLAIWYAALTRPTTLPAITAQLSQTKTSALSADKLLVALIRDYAIDEDRSQALISIMTHEPVVSRSSSPARPTISNAQVLIGQLLQQVIGVLMSDWACGDFQAMASGGMLLNGTSETTVLLGARLGQQEKR